MSEKDQFCTGGDRPVGPVASLLVISDNEELSSHLRSAIAELKNTSLLKVDYCYTAFNLNPQPMIEIGAKKINVKKERVVDLIIENYDMVFSLHCKQIFPDRLVQTIRCINFHPGLNPYNRGWYPQAFSIVNGLPIGATIHLMDNKVDHGAIIAQKEVKVLPSDTSLEVYRKVIAAEKALINENILDILSSNFLARAPISEGNYNGIADYRKLCQLNLKAVGTFGEHLNILRATTHGDFRNAFFIGDDGKKYFVRVEIKEDLQR